jgi:putative serine protease PepD
MTDTETYPLQQTNPTTEPGPYHVQPRNEWPINSPYQHDVPPWPPAQPPTPPDETAGATGAAPNRGRRRMAVAALIAALVLGGGAAGGAIGTQLDHGSTATAGTSGDTATAARIVSSGNLADVVAAVSPSIVDVKVATGQGTAEGSGIVLTSDGRVVTNNHVVESSAGSGAVTITLADGRTAPATVVGTNAQADIAVLQMQGVSGLTPAALGDSSSLSVGDTVLAFGSPLGLQGTVTSGIVSALDRSLSSGSESLSGLVQTDAAINEGNSGGALVDTAGRVVGINVAIATTGQDSGNIGVGFAIPIDTVKTVVNQIVR